MDPDFVQLVPPIEVVSVHPYVPVVVYVCEATCADELWPSPNVHTYDGAPEHPVAVAVAWNSAAEPTAAPDGTVAVHATLHTPAAVAWTIVCA